MHRPYKIPLPPWELVCLYYPILACNRTTSLYHTWEQVQSVQIPFTTHGNYHYLIQIPFTTMGMFVQLPTQPPIIQIPFTTMGISTNRSNLLYHTWKLSRLIQIPLPPWGFVQLLNPTYNHINSLLPHTQEFK